MSPPFPSLPFFVHAPVHQGLDQTRVGQHLPSPPSLPSYHLISARFWQYVMLAWLSPATKLQQWPEAEDKQPVWGLWRAAWRCPPSSSLSTALAGTRIPSGTKAQGSGFTLYLYNWRWQGGFSLGWITSLGERPMDAVKVGKAVIVNKSYINPGPTPTGEI